MSRFSARRGLLLAVAIEFASLSAGWAMDRYLDVHQAVRQGPKMELATATFFGGAGVEEFVGAAVADDGRIVAIGNSWGPPFPETASTRVLGEDRLWNVPLVSVQERLTDRKGGVSLFPPDHPNRTGFLVFYSSDLTRIDQVVRLGWGSASISAVRALRDGSFIIAGRVNRSLAEVPCPPAAQRRQSLPAGLPFVPTTYEGLTLPGDLYVAKLAPDLKGFVWMWTLEGFGDVPTRLYEGGKGEVLFRARQNLWRIAGDGATLRDYSGTPLGRVATRVRGISPTDGRVVVGGTWLIGTGREPWKQPWMDVYDTDGVKAESYYWWSGALVGHDDFRLVSDSSLEMVEPLPNGRYLLSGGSDGGNSVFCRHPSDLTKEPRHSGLPMSTWGAGAGHWSHLVSFNPLDLTDVSYTLWSAFKPGGPESIYVHGLRGLNDGSLVLMGYASPYLVQTTNQWYRATTHYRVEGKPARMVFQKNGWPEFQGLGGHGGYVAVLNPELDSLLWSSVIANCDHTDAVACESGLIVVARCSQGIKFDGRTPAFLAYDIADWPGLVAKLAAAATSGAPSPARQVWQRLGEPLRATLAARRPGEAVTAELQRRVLEEFDEIVFDQRSFYDPAAWPKAVFDAYEQELVEKLKAGAVTDDELGYLNRSLFEQGFPEHVYARPKNNLTPAVRAVQARHGGGASDGYIYLLKAPTGRRLDRAPTAVATTERVARTTTAASATVSSAGRKPTRSGGTAAVGGAFDFQYAPAKRRELRLPNYCTTYAILRNAGKLRPMFLHGWGESGAIRLSYGNDGDLEEDIRLRAIGTGTLLLDGLNTSPAEDWSRFACGEWLLNKKGENPLRVTIEGLRDWQAENDNLAKLVNPARGLMNSEELARTATRFRVRADLQLAVGQHVCALTNLPCQVTLRDTGAGVWAMRLDVATQFRPERLGLAQEGANAVSIRLVHEAFAPPPAGHAAPKTPDLAAPGKLDLKFE